MLVRRCETCWWVFFLLVFYLGFDAFLCASHVNINSTIQMNCLPTFFRVALSLHSPCMFQSQDTISIGFSTKWKNPWKRERKRNHIFHSTFNTVQLRVKKDTKRWKIDTRPQIQPSQVKKKNRNTHTHNGKRRRRRSSSHLINIYVDWVSRILLYNKVTYSVAELRARAPKYEKRFWNVAGCMFFFKTFVVVRLVSLFSH